MPSITGNAYRECKHGISRWNIREQPGGAGTPGDKFSSGEMRQTDLPEHGFLPEGLEPGGNCVVLAG